MVWATLKEGWEKFLWSLVREASRSHHGHAMVSTWGLPTTKYMTTKKTTKSAPKSATTTTTTQAPSANHDAPSAKGQNLFKPDFTYRQATMEEIEKASVAPIPARGLRGQIAEAISELEVKKGIVIKEEFRRVRRMVSAINRNGEVPNKKFFTREYEGEVYIIRES